MGEIMKKKLISVVIPNYNKEKYIKKCLDSVLAQSYSNIEIIIVDDCSSDSSPEIIKEYQKKYENIITVFLKKNGGVSHARNTGIEKANGEYITMIDSDDYYYNPRKLENEISLLNQFNGKGIAYSYRKIVNEEDQLIDLNNDYQEKYISGNIFYQLMTDKDAFAFVQRDYVLPKEYIVKVGGYLENESYYEDYDLLLRLAMYYPMYYTNEDGTAYRLVNTGLSKTQSKNDARQFRIPQQIKKKYISNFKSGVKTKVYILWIIENLRLEIRILGRKVKRSFNK